MKKQTKRRIADVITELLEFSAFVILISSAPNNQVAAGILLLFLASNLRKELK